MRIDPDNIWRFKRIRDERSGATAVEYGLVAGLIALGLVGSLVTTKGSLNAIFGTASSQLGSGVGSVGAPGSTSSVAAYWQSKTLAGPPTHGSSGTSTWTIFTYTDGTTVQFGRNPGASNAETFNMTDPVNHIKTAAWAYDGGQQWLFNYLTYDATMTNLVRGETTSSTQMSGGVPVTENIATYTNGQQTGSAANQTASAAFIAASALTAQNAAYFRDLTK